MYDCVTNSRIINASLDMLAKEDHDACIKTEFKNMCLRCDLSESEMISLVTTLDITLLDNHYDTIWDGLNYYSMICMDKFMDAYIQSVYDSGSRDNRINMLCDDLREYMSNKTLMCIGDNHGCKTLKNACERTHDWCIKYLLNNPKKHKFEDDVCDIPCFYYISFNMSNIIDYLCCCGCSLDIVKYFFEVLGKNCTDIATSGACFNGHLDIVKYLFEVQNIDCSYDAIYCACFNGHLDIVKYLCETLKKKCSKKALLITIKNSHLDVLKYFVEVQGYIVPESNMSYAGDVCIKEYLEKCFILRHQY